MTISRVPNRVRFYVEMISGWLLLVLLIVWTGISNRETIIRFALPRVPEGIKGWLEESARVEDWPWYVWALGCMSILAVYVLESSFKKFQSEKDRADILEDRARPKLEITWTPTEEVYVFRHPPGSPNPSIHYRVCIRNTSTIDAVDGIVVTLDQLAPRALDCVPCRLRLMNNILMPPQMDVRVETFSLNPAARQFIDLMEQKPGSPTFNIWHTVVPQQSTQIPAQAYKMRIVASALKAAPAQLDLELVKNGNVWELRPN
jgi:hypothetical protein